MKIFSGPKETETGDTSRKCDTCLVSKGTHSVRIRVRFEQETNRRKRRQRELPMKTVRNWLLLHTQFFSRNGDIVTEARKNIADQAPQLLKATMLL
jgi:hypothetical protein